MPHTIHANAEPTSAGRLALALALARCIVDDGWSPRRAADRFQVSHTAARRWAERYREAGEAGMVDVPVRPRHSPRRTPAHREQRILSLREERRWGPARIADLHMPASTVHRVPARYRMARLARPDRATGRAIRRYERRSFRAEKLTPARRGCAPRGRAATARPSRQWRP